MTSLCEVPKPVHIKPAKEKKLKKKKCPICKEWFQPFTSTQTTDKYKCALIKAQQDREKREKLETRKKLEALKTLSEHLKDTERVVNAYVRERDKGKPCISCNKPVKPGLLQAGHYRSVGAAPQIRFHEDNIAGQCTHCNHHKSGNQIEYRINLIKRIGPERVEALENNNKPALYTIEDAKRIKLEYREKLKELRLKKCK